ncbi:hypothetical protein L8U60_00220 [Corynebacterium sp. c8Ua_172]|uniref:Uncharacterized protein n=1 Tax=Corynebacterium meitnerae TaxID=2913498 RepID=A0A9X3RIH9_9CORY|nr:hypothetical protein [Corynebacterium meitnerae]
MRRLIDLPAVRFPTRLHVRVPRFLRTATSRKRKIFQESLACTDRLRTTRRSTHSKS